MSGDHPNHSIVEIGQNTEKEPGDLKRLAVSQTFVESHLLKLVWKALKRVAIYWTLCKNEATNETQTDLWRFASLAC